MSGESLKKMTALKDNFGFGLFRVPFYEMEGYGHSGGIDGFHSNAYYFPESKVSVAITQNGTVYPLNDIVVGALSIYFGRDYDLPVFSEPVAVDAAELGKYTGVYSTPVFPLKLTVTIDGGTLTAQGTGQPSFPLECFAKDKFRFDTAGVEIEFVPHENKLLLKQGGMTFEMTRE